MTHRALRKQANLPNRGTITFLYGLLFSDDKKIVLLGILSVDFSCIEIVSFKWYLDSTQSEFRLHLYGND